MKHHRHTSSKRIDANRRNALKSTGPRTPEGKLASRLNAIKHGIFAKEIIASAEAVGDSPKDIERHIAYLVKTFKPVGREQRLAVEAIAVIRIRLARILRAEAAEIERSEEECDEIEGIGSKIYEKTKDAAALRHELREVRCIGGSLPPPRSLEHIIRYETMLNRELIRAVKRLKRLQDDRKNCADQ